MKVLSLLCNNCGAPLEVKEGTKFCTCSFCNSQLKIQDTGNAVFSEVLNAIENRTKKIEQDVETIKLQQELDRLDREWSGTQQQYKIKGKDGHYSVPNKQDARKVVSIGVVAGIIWTVIAFSITNMGPGRGFGGFGSIFPLFGLVFAGIAAFSYKNISKKAEIYEQARDEYLRQRHEIVDKIQKQG